LAQSRPNCGNFYTKNCKILVADQLTITYFLFSEFRTKYTAPNVPFPIIETLLYFSIIWKQLDY